MRRFMALAVLSLGLLTLPITSAFAEDPPADPVAEEVSAETPEDAPEADAEEADAPEADAEETEASVPETDAEALAVAVSMIDALKAGQYPLAAGLFLTLLVFLVNRFSTKDLIPDKWEPVLAFGVGFAGATGTGLAMGTPVGEALAAGAIAGLAGVGGWQMAVKALGDLKPSKKEADPEPPAEEDAKA
jgi:hypothetical protein